MLHVRPLKIRLKEFRPDEWAMPTRMFSLVSSNWIKNKRVALETAEKPFLEVLYKDGYRVLVDLGKPEIFELEGTGIFEAYSEGER